MVETTSPFVAEDAIMKRWLTEWDARTFTTFENAQFTPPPLLEPGGELVEVAWARVLIRAKESMQETLGPPGSRRFQRKSEVFVQLFVPVDTGTAEANTLAQIARAVFEGVKINSDIHFGAGIIEPIGVTDRWYQVNVTVPFDYWETK